MNSVYKPYAYFINSRIVIFIIVMLSFLKKKKQKNKNLAKSISCRLHEISNLFSESLLLLY